MQRFVHAAAILFLAAGSASAGITYDFTSTTTGLSNQTIAGRVQTEGDRTRVDVATGDGVLFENGSYVVSSNGGLVMRVVNPAARTFYELDLSQVLGGADGLLKQLGSDVRIDVRNPRVSVSAAADAGKIEGFPAKKSTVNAKYELAINAFGQPMTVTIQLDSDVWWTEQLPSAYTNFLQLRGLRTGVESVDKIVAAQENAISGFPLKQVTTTKISLGGNDMTSTTTSIVRNVKQAAITPDAFVVPPSFAKAANPVEKMFGSMNR